MLYCVQCKHYTPSPFGARAGEGACDRPREMEEDAVTGRQIHRYRDWNLTAFEERSLKHSTTKASLPTGYVLCGPKAVFFEPEGLRPVNRRIGCFPGQYWTSVW